MINHKKFHNSILFSRQKNPGFGGMESHQIAFAEQCNIQITAENGYNVYIHDEHTVFTEIQPFLDSLQIIVKKEKIINFFFNDLAFITIISQIKERCPDIKFILRSGGNDLYRAPLGDDNIKLSLRQKTICSIINKSIDILIVNSDYSYIRSLQFGITPNIIKKIRGGVGQLVNGAITSVSLTNKGNFKTYYNVGERVLFVFSCRMKRFKGILEFLKEFISYPQKEKFFLVFAGNGDYLPTIQEFVKNNKLNAQCTFLGELTYNDSLKVISFADYLVNPSIEERRFYGNESYIHTETMGRSMMEALSQNIPIIASNVGGTKELFYECMNAGYLINDRLSLSDILDRVLQRPYATNISCPDYSWECVFDKYLKLVNIPSKSVLVLDLDDTILKSDDDIRKVKFLLDKKRSLFYLIFNTARILDNNLKLLCEYLGADFCIANNGSEIYSSKRTIWNDKSFLYDKVVKEADCLFKLIQKSFENCEIKKTQQHIIQLRLNNSVRSEELIILDDLIKNTSFNYISHNNLIKVYSSYMSKGSALLFILKDIFYDKIYAAGNGLNDCLFLMHADYAWMAEDLKDIVMYRPNITYFNNCEVGERLLSNILNKISNSL